MSISVFGFLLDESAQNVLLTCVLEALDVGRSTFYASYIPRRKLQFPAPALPPALPRSIRSTSIIRTSLPSSRHLMCAERHQEWRLWLFSIVLYPTTSRWAVLAGGSGKEGHFNIKLTYANLPSLQGGFGAHCAGYLLW